MPSKNSGNNFKLETVKDIAKLDSSIKILNERLSGKIDNLQKDVQELSESIKRISQPCNQLKNHLEEHRNLSSKGIIAWAKKKPLQAFLILLVIISQLGISIDKLIEILTKIIKIGI